MAKHLSINAGELQVHIARIHHLAIAANCIRGGCGPAEPARTNCVIYLTDTIEYLAEQATDWAEHLQAALELEDAQ